MTPKEAWKFGFLMRCAEEGLSPAELDARVEKAAALQKSGNWGDSLKSLLVTYPIMLPALAGAGLGGLGGAGLASAVGPRSNLEDEFKRKELANMYDFYTEQLRRRNAIVAQKQHKPKVVWSS